MKRLNPLVLAVRQLRREWRSGELAVLIAALIVAVGALSSIGFATDRVRQGVERRAAESLAGDLVIRSRNEIPREFDARAEAAGLATARVVDFPSVVTTAERGQLAEVRAVNDGYPLRGRLEVATQAYGEATPTDELPGPGEVWAEPRLVGALGIDVGDEVSLGGKRFRLTRVIDFAPDQGFSFVEIAPMLLVRHSELLDTSLLGPMSRLSHRLLIAGERSAVDRFRADIEDELGPGQRLLDIRDARPELASAVMRADRFLNLAALVAVVLAGVAIAMAEVTLWPMAFGMFEGKRMVMVGTVHMMSPMSSDPPRGPSGSMVSGVLSGATSVASSWILKPFASCTARANAWSSSLHCGMPIAFMFS